MLELCIAIIGLAVLFVFGRSAIARRERAKVAAIGLGLLAVGVYQGMIYDLTALDVLLLHHRLTRFNSILIVDVPLALGYGVFLGAALSMFFPGRSRVD